VAACSGAQITDIMDSQHCPQRMIQSLLNRHSKNQTRWRNGCALAPKVLTLARNLRAQSPRRDVILDILESSPLAAKIWTWKFGVPRNLHFRIPILVLTRCGKPKTFAMTNTISNNPSGYQIFSFWMNKSDLRVLAISLRSSPDSIKYKSPMTSG